RLEREAITRSPLAAPENYFESQAEQAVRSYFPEMEVQLERKHSSSRFRYYTFQQIFNGLTIHGAKGVVRINQAGEWETLSTTFVAPTLLRDQTLTTGTN